MLLYGALGQGQLTRVTATVDSAGIRDIDIMTNVGSSYRSIN